MEVSYLAWLAGAFGWWECHAFGFIFAF